MGTWIPFGLNTLLTPGCEAAPVISKTLLKFCKTKNGFFLTSSKYFFFFNNKKIIFLYYLYPQQQSLIYDPTCWFHFCVEILMKCWEKIASLCKLQTSYIFAGNSQPKSFLIFLRLASALVKETTNYPKKTMSRLHEGTLLGIDMQPLLSEYNNRLF